MQEFDRGTSGEDSRFNMLSTDQLRSILNRDSELEEEETPEKLVALAKLLSEREGSGETCGAAWERFRRTYLPYATDAAPLYDLEEEPAAERKKPRLLTRAAGIAAVLALLLGIGSLSASARGYDLFGAVASWTRGTFTFEKPSGRREIFPNLSAALSVYEVKGKLIPTWLPEDYGEDKLDIAETPDGVIFHTGCASGDKELYMMVHVHGPERLGKRVYESDPGEPTVYVAGGVKHYLMTNRGWRRAVWITGNLECAIRGKFTEEELEKIIDSIYRE